MCLGSDACMIEGRTVLLAGSRLRVRYVACRKGRHVEIFPNKDDFYRILIGFEKELFLSI
jgi:hypothetical protein